MAAEKTYIRNPLLLVKQIKRKQYLRQIPPILVIILGIGLQFWFPSGKILYYPALALAIGGIIWDLWILGSFRYNDKIVQPPEGVVVSPLEGKIKFIRQNPDLTLINISKSFLDELEIRSPHDKTIFEDDMLKLHLESGTVSFRFNAREVIWFERPDFSTGSLIGMMIGAGSCTVSLPHGIDSELKTGDDISCGQSMITTIKGEPRAQRSITIE